MTIGGIGYGGYTPYYSGIQRVTGIQGVTGVQGVSGITGVEDENKKGDRTGKVDKSQECQTCKNRKYVDGSDEENVSFKTPGHIDPNNAAAVVSAHEGMHVANAVKEGNKENADLVSATVSLKTSVCPECGRTYVSGGTTNTTIKYSESNPYEKNRKLLEGSFLKGQVIDSYL